MNVHELIERINLESVTEISDNKEISGCYIGDLLSWVMSRAKQGDVWITVQTNINIVAVASLTDCACIILCDGVADITEDVIKKAEMQDVTILKSTETSFNLACRIKELL